MPKFNKQLRILRQESGLSQQELADKIGVSKSSINMYERGEREPGLETLEAIADYFNVDMDFLLGKADKRNEYLENNSYIPNAKNILPLPKFKKIPLIGTVACGEPILAEENVEGYCNCPENIDADFCLRAKGDSMINARIFDGDILFVHKQDIVEDGEVAAVLIEDEATVKRVYYDREENTLTLVPENPKYKVMRFHGEQLNQIRIIGKVIAGRYEVK